MLERPCMIDTYEYKLVVLCLLEYYRPATVLLYNPAHKTNKVGSFSLSLSLSLSLSHFVLRLFYVVSRFISRTFGSLLPALIDCRPVTPSIDVLRKYDMTSL